VTIDIRDMARQSKATAAAVATLPTNTKNACLLDLADRLTCSGEALRAANGRDLASARDAGLTDAKLRRLVLDEPAIRQMADGLRQVASLPDPVGQVTREYTVPSGLRVQKVRCPIGVILMIYEARPNVTVDAFALCFKAGNACILKGGREAVHSNETLARIIHDSLRANGVPAAALTLLTTSDRREIRELLSCEESIDLVIPRGGAPLIHFVHEHSRIPTVQHFHGVCHIYVDACADLNQALEICATAKTSAPATCNAAECILIHETVAQTFVPRLIERYTREGVEVRGDPIVCSLAAGNARRAGDDDWGREFLDLTVAVRVVSDLEAAIAHIQRYGSNHTDAIITKDNTAASRFLDRVQSSCTLVNASTRFNDGFQLGLGAEIGISTSKIHAFGPMGLEELTTQRYLVHGAGQTR